uniref:AAA family ATPase n=1 Tax=Ndongobacter massiliensis TaxID=1871025 RepID=UPI000931F4D2|nr:AAA family ATPase [Ndongobacter massiliensis]
MIVTLKKLQINNFKGIEHLSIDFSEHTRLCGANATGKTSVYDAYLWLLVGKDSMDSASFAIKPREKSGEEKHRIETSVEGVFDVDGEELTLRKTYAEQWTKKRGSTSESFTGHTTDYEWQGVPVKKSEYEEKLAAIVDEKTLKLLSNPRYFNTVLKDTERREQLLQLTDIEAVEKTLQSDEQFAELSPLLVTYNVEDILKMQKASARKINKEIDEIPARVDELSGMICTRDFGALRASKETLAKKLQELQIGQKTPEGILAEMAQLRGEIASYDKKIREIEQEERKEIDKLLLEKREAADQAQDSLRTMRQNMLSRKDEVSRLQEEIATYEKKLSSDRKRYEEVQMRVYDGQSNCPTCGQALPKEQIQKAIAKFHQSRAEELEAITTRGLHAKKEQDELRIELEKAESIIEELNESVQCAEKAAKTTQDDLIATKEEVSKRPEPKEIAALQKKRRQAEQRLSQKGEAEKPSEHGEEIRNIQRRMEEIDSDLAYEKINSDNQARIKELEERQKELGKAYEKTQRIIALCEAYTREKMSAVSEQVDSHFSTVHWQLFEEQINGGIKDTCKALIGGVPYESANNAAQINAGLDIIRAFGRQARVQVPVFVDNAESVNDLLDIGTQCIALVVSQDKTLKIQGE